MVVYHFIVESASRRELWNNGQNFLNKLAINRRFDIDPIVIPGNAGNLATARRFPDSAKASLRSRLSAPLRPQ
jgi:hypothetical protein